MNYKKFSAVRPYFKAAVFSSVHIYKLFKIGIGSALQFTFEVAAFILCGLMTGWFGEKQFDGHGIAMSLAAFTYMFGSGISGAASIRVANFRATADYANLKLAGKSAFVMIVSLMGFIALLFMVFRDFLPLPFSKDADVIGLASDLLIFAAFFQLFDGTQVVALGILRGMEDVKFPTVVTLIAYWVIALPLAYYLAVSMNYKAYGVWAALSISLVIVAVALYWRFRFLVKIKPAI